MKGTFFLAVVAILALSVQAHYRRVGCSPRKCGSAEDVTLTSSMLTEGYGPNVCNFTRKFTAMTITFEETRLCNARGRCVTACTRSSNCSVPMEFSQSFVDCCEGFAISSEDLAEETHWRFLSRKNTLRERGCNLELEDTVINCLVNLNVSPFVNELLSNSDLFEDLTSGEEEFTVFALSSAPEDIAVHVVRREIEGKWLRSGVILETLSENVSLHVRSVGEKVFINGVEVVETDACRARNGIVHVVSSPFPHSNQTIASILSDEARFSVFQQLLEASGVLDFLDARKKSRTVLAPTDEAFAKLPDNAVQCLLQEENKAALNQLVLLHIGSPAEYSSSLAQQSKFFTFNTRYYLVVSAESGEILLTRDEIPLEEADIPATNGVIHVLPQVIVPPTVNFNTLCPTSGGDTEVVGA